MSNTNISPLTRLEVQKIIDAFGKLNDLSEQVVISSLKAADEAQRTALQEFVLDKLFTHASEFLGCWIVMNEEYDPLIRGFSSLLARAHQTLGEAARQRQASAQSQVSKATNIVNMSGAANPADEL